MSRSNQDEAPTTLGAKIRAAREAAGFRQADVAARAGVHTNTLSRVEKGLLCPTVELFMRLAIAIGVPAASLLPDPSTVTGCVGPERASEGRDRHEQE